MEDDDHLLRRPPRTNVGDAKIGSWLTWPSVVSLSREMDMDGVVVLPGAATKRDARRAGIRAWTLPWSP